MTFSFSIAGTGTVTFVSSGGLTYRFFCYGYGLLTISGSAALTFGIFTISGQLYLIYLSGNLSYRFSLSGVVQIESTELDYLRNYINDSPTKTDNLDYSPPAPVTFNDLTYLKRFLGDA